MIIVLLIIVAIFLFLLHYGYKLAFYYIDPQESPYAYEDSDQTRACKAVFDAAIADFENESCEEVTVKSADGLTLYARYYHVKDNGPVEIMCHGYKGNAIRDFCGNYKIAKEAGRNVLLIDERCHRKSEGHTITFGINERKDVLCWVRYVNERFGNPSIILTGVSMGAATVLMASSLALPEGVVGIISDSAYTSPRDILFKVGKQLHYPKKIMGIFIAASAFIFGGFDIDSADCIESVKNTKLPVLFLHGQDDFFVPCRMSRKVFAACKDNKSIVTFSNGGHCAAYIFNTEKYVNAINDFCKRTLK